ncbi:hypothetical protein AcV5_002641 [Taiwanofungus camphoratus]|nr:hypothetical protein AcV5_002641 [Antrodia cinnamomea]KAI0918840.1 hypothetical protein AcV7_006955 [Antrodia cinnamomea]
MLPLLYTTITLTSSTQIVNLASSLMSYENHESELPGSPLASYVRHIWFGPTSDADQHDLLYASSAWPMTLLHQILSLCRSLRALAMVNLSQNLLYRLIGIIPDTVECVYLGPVHGFLDPIRTRVNMRSISSLDTYLSDWKVQQVVTSPAIRCFRRLFSRPEKVSLAFDQLPCVKNATSLEQMQIVCCDETVEDAAQVLGCLAEEYKEFCEDQRVLLVPRSNHWNGRVDGIHVLYDDWKTHLGLY